MMKMFMFKLWNILLSICSADLCDYKVQTTKHAPLLNLHSKQLPTLRRNIEISTNDNNETCDINTDNFLSDLRVLTTDIHVVLFAFSCSENTNISFRGVKEQPAMTNIISYVQIYKCIFNNEDMDDFLLLTNTHVYTLQDSMQSINSAAAPLCKGFPNIQSLGIISMQDDENEYINAIFSCPNKTSGIKEIVLHGCQTIVNQVLLKEKFPGMQSMDITACSINGTLNYPWTEDVAYLPNNLSRSDYLQNHYIESLHINIPAKIFRRQLVLIKNLVNLEQVILMGLLHYIEISLNTIPKIANDSFKNVRGLQVIILNRNGLTEIENAPFSSLTELTYIDLSENDLQDLPSGVFKNLTNLQRINLGRNKLENLPDKLFLTLDALVEINLDQNYLLSLDDQVLPINSVRLNTVTLNNNPLTEFPTSLLYIRSLQKAELKFTSLSFNNMTVMINNIKYNQLIESITKSSSSFDLDILKTTDSWRIIDLTGSKVRGFIVDQNLNSSMKFIVLAIFKHFQFVLKDNPLTCFSDIIPFNMIMKQFSDEGHWNGKEYFYTDWLCENPPDFYGERVLTIDKSRTYNLISDSNCPAQCRCFRRLPVNVAIVNCRGQNLTTTPTRVPDGLVDIWLEHNKIENLEFKEYFQFVRQLYISHNILKEISHDIFTSMEHLQALKLDNNVLSYLPESLQSLHLEELDMNNNPLVCDCKTKWLKEWMLGNIKIIKNLKYTTCLHNGHKTMQILSVPETDFRCSEEIIHQHFVIPFVVSTTVLIIVILTLFLMYIYRQEIKILLYMKFEWHPFDRQNPKDYEILDLTVIHLGDTDEFVEKYIMQPLLSRNFVVNCSSKNFTAGYSIQNNVASAVYHSKHILLLLSNNMVSHSRILDHTWLECQEKLQSRLDFLIITSASVHHEDMNLNKDFKRYLKLHAALKINSYLFLKKIIYVLSSYTNAANLHDNTLCMRTTSEHRLPLYNNYQSSNEQYDIFVSFTDEEKDFCEQKLIPDLVACNFRVISPDDFHPGNNVMNSILQAVVMSTHTIFVTSSPTPSDSIHLKYTFPIALQKTRDKKYNHLIVVFLEEKDGVSHDTDFEHYLSTHLFLETKHNLYFERLIRSLQQKVETHFSGIEVILNP